MSPPLGLRGALHLLCREVARAPWVALSALDYRGADTPPADPEGGPPVLVLGGFLSHPAYYAPLGRALGRDGWSVHFDDALNARPFVPHVADLAERSARLADAYGVPVRVVGHSLGGLQALALLQQRPDTVSQVVAVASPVIGGTPWQPLQRLAEHVLRVGIDDADAMRARLDGLADRITTISVPGDMIAPPARCALPGAHNVVLNTVPGSDRSLASHTGMIFMRSVMRVVVAMLARERASAQAVAS